MTGLKKLLSIVLAMTLMLTFSVGAVATEGNETYQDSGSKNITTAGQLNTAPKNEVNVLFDSLDKDWYGGIYYVDDVIHIIATAGHAEDIQSCIGSPQRKIKKNTFVVDDPTKNKNAKTVYSLNELEAAKEDLLAQADDLDIIGVGFNGKHNALAVYMNDFDSLTEKQKNAIIEKSLAKNILFRDGRVLMFDKSIETETTTNDVNYSEDDPTAKLTIRGGNWLARSDGNWCTLATSATYDGMKGFVTCGHGWSVGDSVYYNGTNIGTVRFVNQADTADISFIESKYTSNGYMNGGAQIIDTRYPETDMRIKAYGVKTGQLSGNILDINVSGNWAGINFDWLFSTDINTTNGDSGAAYVYDNSLLVGVLKGGLEGFSESVGTASDQMEVYGVYVSY